MSVGAVCTSYSGQRVEYGTRVSVSRPIPIASLVGDAAGKALAATVGLAGALPWLVVKAAQQMGTVPINTKASSLSGLPRMISNALHTASYARELGVKQLYTGLAAMSTGFAAATFAQVACLNLLHAYGVPLLAAAPLSAALSGAAILVPENIKLYQVKNLGVSPLAAIRQMLKAGTLFQGLSWTVGREGPYLLVFAAPASVSEKLQELGYSKTKADLLSVPLVVAFAAGLSHPPDVLRSRKFMKLLQTDFPSAVDRIIYYCRELGKKETWTLGFACRFTAIMKITAMTEGVLPLVVRRAQTLYAPLKSLPGKTDPQWRERCGAKAKVLEHVFDATFNTWAAAYCGIGTIKWTKIISSNRGFIKSLERAYGPLYAVQALAMLCFLGLEPARRDLKQHGIELKPTHIQVLSTMWELPKMIPIGK